MRILNFVRKSVFGNPSKKRSGTLFTMQNGVHKITEENALEVSDILTCVRVLAESIACLPLCVYLKTDNGGQKAYEHPLYELLRWQPNANMTSYDLRLWMMTDALLRGNGVAQVIRDGSGNVVELYPLFASKLKYHIMEDGTLHYVYPDPDDEENEIMLEQNEVLHIRCFASGELISPSLIDLGNELLSGAKGAEAYTREFYENGSAVSGVIEYPDEMDEETFERLKADWSSKYSGTGNRHKTPILEGGAKFTPISLSHAETQMLESRKYTRSQIAGLFRVPAHLINDLERATFSNITEQDLGFVKHTLRPWLCNWEQKLRMTLLSDTEKGLFYFKHNTNDLLRGDLPSRMTAYSQAIQNGILSPNDVRRKEDEKTYDGGDTYYVNGAMLPVESVGEETDAMALMQDDDYAEDEYEHLGQTSKTVEKTLKEKLSKHKEKVGSDSAKQTTLAKLKTVFKRGVGAFRTNPPKNRPNMNETSWGIARVNSFLYALRNGRFKSGKHDTDLLPASHPVRKSMDGKNEIVNKTYNDYPQSATNNAKRALKWVAKNGWGGCGTAVGKQRASQLANRESLSRDTIARMASFKRHQKNKDVPYGEGCGGLMWDCWGGTSGVEWAIRKLKQIDKE